MSFQLTFYKLASYTYEIRRFNIIKMALLPNLNYRFCVIPIRIPASYFVDIDKLIFIWNIKSPRIANTMLKKNGVGGLKLFNFKTYYKAIVIMTVWRWQKNSHIDQ